MQAKQYTLRMHIRKIGSGLREEGTALLRRGRNNLDPLTYPNGLGLALIAAADVCRLVSRHDKLDLAALFDGGEERGANLYTRMRCVRDLCSSALFAVGIHELRSSAAIDSDFAIEPAKPLILLWSDLIHNHANAMEPETVKEVAQLCDDVFESLFCAVEWLKASRRKDPGAWGEISRHIQHIRDHFDYAEHALIHSLRKSEEGATGRPPRSSG